MFSHTVDDYRAVIPDFSPARSPFPRVSPSPPSFPPSPSVIPAKAGIQTIAVRLAIRNQVQIAVSGSLLPLWEKARMRARGALARLCGRTIQTLADFSPTNAVDMRFDLMF